jgi:nucleoside triphosphate pyrophosphatase
VKPLVLASGSPRRQQLLDMLGIPYRVVVPDVDETYRVSEAPEAYVVRLARAKVGVVAAREPAALVLGADTSVVVRGEVLGKPTSREEAALMLGKLAGRTHHVMTGVALAAGDRVEDALDVTDVTFRPFDGTTIADYVTTGEPMDKAGAYGVQGRGAALVEGIRGDFFSVMGLPLRLVLDLLERFGHPYRFTR